MDRPLSSERAVEQHVRRLAGGEREHARGAQPAVPRGSRMVIVWPCGPRSLTAGAPPRPAIASTPAPAAGSVSVVARALARPPAPACDVALAFTVRIRSVPQTGVGVAPHGSVSPQVSVANWAGAFGMCSAWSVQIDRPRSEITASPVPVNRLLIFSVAVPSRVMWLTPSTNPSACSSADMSSRSSLNAPPIPISAVPSGVAFQHTYPLGPSRITIVVCPVNLTIGYLPVRRGQVPCGCR